MQTIIVTFLVLVLSGCAATTQMTLVNQKGEEIYCQGSSTWGAISAIQARSQFNSCVNEAGLRGFKPKN